MKGKLLEFLNNTLFDYIKNKDLFRKWVLIKSMWFYSFIQRGTFDKIWKGKSHKTMKWWQKKEGLETDWQGNGWVYSLLCTKTGDWYIGSTKRSLEERLREHLYETNRVWEKDKMERTALHKAMWRTRCTNWIIIPIKRMEDETSLRNLERCLIRKMKPNLNRQLKKEKRKHKVRKRPNKRERGGRKMDKNGNNLPALWSWTYEDKETLDFSDIIEMTRKPITWNKGIIDSTNWEKLKESFRIEAKIEDGFGGMQMIKKKMREKDSGTLKIITCVKKDLEWEKRMRDIMKEGLNTVSDDLLVKLWRKRKILKKSEKSKMTRKLNEELKKRKMQQFPCNIVLRIPRYYSNLKAQIMREIQLWIKGLNTQKQWKKLLAEEIKIVETKNKTVGETLLNFRSYAKSDWFKINKCTCLEKKTEGRDETCHEIWKLEEKEEIFKQLTTKTVLPPNGRRENRIVKKEIKKLGILVNKVVGCDIMTGPKISFQNQKMEQELLEVKRRWKDWVIIERDKNNGTMAVACPMWYRNKLLETFDWTKWRANYQKIGRTEEEILKKWKKTNTKRLKKMI